MSSQRSLYYDYAQRSLQPSNRIDEEAYETENVHSSGANTKMQSPHQNDLQVFAKNVSQLPEMPDAVKNMAKAYMDGQISLPPKEEKKKMFDTFSNKLLRGIQSIGNSNGSQSRNAADQNLINRSMSQKSLNNNIASRNLNMDVSEIHSDPKMSARIKEISNDHFSGTGQDRISQTIYNAGSKGGGGYANIGSIKGFSKNIIVSQSSIPHANKLSPLPQKYKQHLPNIIKKKMQEEASISFNAQPAQAKKELKNLEYLQSQMRQDVSFLNEQRGSLNANSQMNQPTVLTTGNKGQDELLEALGLRNMGKSLISLPQTIDELFQIMKSYDTFNQPLGKKYARYEQEEKYLETYIQDNFFPLDMTKDVSHQKDLQLPGITIKQHQNNFQSKFLNNQQSSVKTSGTSPYQHFNFQDKKNSVDIVNLDKQPPLINTKPDNLVLIDEGVIKRFGSRAFLNKEHSPQQNSERKQLDKKQKSQMELPQSDGKLKLKNIGSKSQLKTVDNIFSNSKFQSLQNSWMKEEKSTDRNVYGRNENVAGSLSPINMKTQKNIQNNQVITQITASQSQQHLGNPSSRQDAILLIVWFEKILMTIQSELSSDQKDEKLFPLLQLVMNICIKELARQVSVQCTERGLILTRVFQSYTKLIDLINKEHKQKRWALKREYADKLDRYITIQEGQIQNYQNKIAEQSANYERLKQDLDEYLFRLNQGNVLLSKFKKKLYNTQKDLDGSQRRVRFVEKENEELREKIKELSDKIGEEMSEFDDEAEKRRLMMKVDQEILEEVLMNQDNNLDDTIDLEQMPIRDIIKEEDRGTDMRDFDLYLELINQGRFQTSETQTERVFKKHKKIGVQAHKLGMMKDRETFIDPRMFQGEGTQQLRIGGETNQNIANQAHNLDDLQEADSDEEGDNSDDNSLRENDETFNELGNNIDGFISLDVSQIRNLKRSLSNNAGEIDDLDDLDLQDQPLYGTQQMQEIIQKAKFKKQQHASNIVSGPLYHMLGQNAEIQADEDEILNKKPKKKKALTLMQLFAQRIRQRIKGLVKSEDFGKLREENPNFVNSILGDLQNTSKEVKQMGIEFSKKDKQVRFQFKLNKKNEKELKEAILKVDQLEMDNYLLREQINDIIRSLDEYEQMIGEIFKFVDRDSMGQMTINELKNKLNALQERLLQGKNKVLNQVLEGEDPNKSQETITNAYASNENTVTMNPFFNKEIIDLEESENIQGGGDDQPSNYQFIILQQIILVLAGTLNLIMAKKERKDKKVETILQLLKQNKSKIIIVHSSNRIMRKRAITRFQQFNIGKRNKTPKRYTQHPAWALLKKVQRKDEKKLKDIMPRKMMLRVIGQVYQEKGYFDLSQQPIQPNQTSTMMVQGAPSQMGDKALSSTQMTFNANQNSQAPLIEWIYDNFMQKYGLKNVAEKKFIQLVSSCVIQKDSLHRIRIFGRFLEVYHELGQVDYNRYLEMVDLFTQQILNFKINDDLDSILLPVIERMKVPVGIEDAKTQMHLKGIREAVDFDRFAEYVIDSYNFIQEERESTIKDIYLAVDINNDGLMSYNEFLMLMKVLHYKSSKENWKLFEEYATEDQDPLNKNVKYMNLDQFTQLCMDKEFFTPKIQYYFIQSKNVEKDFEGIVSDIPWTISKLKSRLTAIEMDNDFEYLELLENFQNSIKYPFSARVGWLCYRVVDELLKRLYLKKMSEQFMPVDLRNVGIKLKPSQNLLNMLPLSLFDTI